MILIALLLWPLLEIAAAIVVAHFIGILLCLLALAAGIPAGVLLTRAEARSALRGLRETLVRGRPPGAGALDGALGLLAGPLLIVPGFLTDALALTLLMAPARRLLGRRLARHARGRLATRAAGARRGSRRPDDADASAHDTPTPPRPQLHG